ncbi:hypothetical protein J7643_12710 [bacterium]|nr:hypothetical protein [bacterium]
MRTSKVVVSLLGAGLLLGGCSKAERGDLFSSKNGLLKISAEVSSRYPDLVATPAASIYLKQNGRKVEFRFSNTIGNAGPGHLQIRAVPRGSKTSASQEIMDDAGQLVQSRMVGEFTYHPTHQHTHLDSVCNYELRQGSPTGPIVRQAEKVSFCMTDTIPYGTGGVVRRYADCQPNLQGISSGWADVYGSEVPEQDLDVAGLAPGEYYLLIILDPNRKFIESNTSNNTSWIRVYLDPANLRVNRLGASSEVPSEITGDGRFWRPFWRRGGE